MTQDLLMFFWFVHPLLSAMTLVLVGFWIGVCVRSYEIRRRA